MCYNQFKGWDTMKKLISLFALLLVLSACSGKHDQPLLYECIYTEDTGYGEYIEVLSTFHINEKDPDVIDKEEMLYSTIFTYDFDTQEMDLVIDESASKYADTKGVTFQNRYDTALYQESLVFDYTLADFKQLVDKGHLDLVDGIDVPDYISKELTLEGLQADGYKCHAVEDGNASYKADLLVKDYGASGTEALEVLPQLEVDYRYGTQFDRQIKRCSAYHQEYPELTNYVELEYDEQLDMVLKSTRHEEFVITDPNFDYATLEQTSRDTGTAYNAVEGMSYSYSLNGSNFTQDISIDYETVDFNTLVEMELLGLVDGQVPTYISYSQTLNSYIQQGLSCE